MVVSCWRALFWALGGADDEVLTYDDIATRLYDLERLATSPIEGERGMHVHEVESYFDVPPEKK